MPLHYADTSALAKLIVDEPESATLLQWLRAKDRTVVTSDLTRTELMRAVLRTDPDRADLVGRVLAGLVVVTLTTAEFEAAGRLAPASLRSLDALHLASALVLADELESMVTYDDRLAAAAVRHGLSVAAPTP